MTAKAFLWGRTLALIFILLVIGFAGGRLLTSPAAAVQAQDEVQAIAPEMPTAPDYSSFACPTITNIAAFNNRIHVKCSNLNGDIYYYAYPNDPANTAVANQILAAANTAFALNRPAWVYYYADTSFNPPGCNIGDCRGLYGISVVK